MNPRREEERRLSNGEEVKWLKSSPVRGEAHLYIYIYLSFLRHNRRSCIALLDFFAKFLRSIFLLFPYLYRSGTLTGEAETMRSLRASQLKRSGSSVSLWGCQSIPKEGQTVWEGQRRRSIKGDYFIKSTNHSHGLSEQWIRDERAWKNIQKPKIGAKCTIIEFKIIGWIDNYPYCLHFSKLRDEEREEREKSLYISNMISFSFLIKNAKKRWGLIFL